MSIDGRVRDTEPRDDGSLVIHIEPRWDFRVHRFSMTGEEHLIVDPPVTWTPEPGIAIWGNSETIVVEDGNPAHRYERISIVHLREADA